MKRKNTFLIVMLLVVALLFTVVPQQVIAAESFARISKSPAYRELAEGKLEVKVTIGESFKLEVEQRKKAIKVGWRLKKVIVNKKVLKLTSKEKKNLLVSRKTAGKSVTIKLYLNNTKVKNWIRAGVKAKSQKVINISAMMFITPWTPMPMVTVTPPAQVTPTPTSAPTVSATPPSQVTPTPTLAPTVSATPPAQVTPTPTLAPTVSTTPLPQVTPTPTSAPIVSETPPAQATPTPTLAPTVSATPPAQVTPTPKPSIKPGEPEDPGEQGPTETATPRPTVQPPGEPEDPGEQGPTTTVTPRPSIAPGEPEDPGDTWPTSIHTNMYKMFRKMFEYIIW